MALSFRIAGILGLTLSIVAGIWLDQMPVLDQTPLFIIFQVISLLGVIAMLLWWLNRINASIVMVILMAIAALIAWRVSYFPIMVFAGWIATLGEQLQVLVFKNSTSTIIYPVFLLAMYAMHSLTVWAAGAVITLRHKKFLVLTLPAFAIAVMVSFSTASDFKILPDYQTNLDQPLPTIKTPKANPYLTALSDEAYTIPQRVFIFSAGSIYALIPHSPWSKAVKGTIEEAFRMQPHSTTTNRILEHYLAYHAAHNRIHCREKCS